MNKIIFENENEYSEWSNHIEKTHYHLKWKFLGGDPNKYPMMVVYNIEYDIVVEEGNWSHSGDCIEFCIVNENFNI